MAFKTVIRALDSNEQVPEIYPQFRDRILKLTNDFQFAKERYEQDRLQDVENSLRRLLGVKSLRVHFFTKEGSLATAGAKQICKKSHQVCKCFKKRLHMRLRLDGGLLFQYTFRQKACRLKQDSDEVVYLPEEADETWSIEPEFLDANEFDEETLKGEIRQVLAKYKRF